MSQNHAMHAKYGFCDAIFSSTPISLNQEDKTSSKNARVLFKDPITKSNGQEKISKEEPLNVHYNLSSKHLNSLNTVQKEKCIQSENVLTEKLNDLGKEKMSTVSQDKPSTTLSTLLEAKGVTPIARSKLNVVSSAKTPMKQYFSNNSVPKATPKATPNYLHIIDTPSTRFHEVGLDEQTVCEGETSNLTVGIRIRPLNSKELDDPKVTSIVSSNAQNITVDCDSSQHTFTYDHCFISYVDRNTPGHANQEIIFNTMVLPLVQNAFDGYNVCLLAYGQTGSGKSYSMMGSEILQTSSAVISEETGIIPRFCQEIFSKILKDSHMTTTVEISYLEIYNEKIHDLLVSTSNGAKKTALKVREHPVFGPYVVDLSQHSIQNYKDLQVWLKVGNSQRVTAATGMNEKSSRSHSIFSIILTQTQIGDQLDIKSIDASRRSKINLVDLAGSERLSQASVNGDRLKEGVSINKSLLTLGKVIAALTENSSNRKRGFVPYRESVLTWLLKESLGGNSRTAMLGTVSPVNIHIEETLATLRYACQARAIVNRIRINENPHDKLIRELKAEVMRLRGVHEGYDKQREPVPRRLFDDLETVIQSNEEIQEKQQEIEKLKCQLRKTEEQLATSQMTWQEKLQKAEEKKNSELRYLRRCGIAVEIDFRKKHRQPCLVNLTADPMLSGTLLYLIPPGTVRVGRNSGETKSSSLHLDIALDGPLVRPLHCTIQNNSGKLTLSSEMNGDTYVNGQMVTGKVHLKHGDRLVIGGNHYFKVTNPQEVQGTTQSNNLAVDFEFAHQEILRVQEEKLRAELEESKQKAVKELECAKHEVELQLGYQKSSYEHKIKILGSTLAEQKMVLDEINRKKKELELEKELLATEVETSNRIRRIQHEENEVNVSPYKSNFLQELENILSQKTNDIESVLKMQVGKDTINSGGISLHEMQIFVREATERCREIGLHYEFHQQQVVVNRSLQPVIRVRDKDHMVETCWEVKRFLGWIQQLRDHDIEDSMAELCYTDDEWQPYRNDETFDDSLNASRISINLSTVRKQLNESIHHSPFNSPLREAATTDQNELVLLQRVHINTCVAQIEHATKSLSSLCNQHENEDMNSFVSEYVNKMLYIINDFKKAFESKAIYQKHKITNSEDVITGVREIPVSNTNNVEVNFPLSPTKSAIRQPISSTNSNRLKTVTFTDKAKD